ncbi:MAG TPA: alpha/beta hydrolase-fold protein [Paucimonas sp.]|nr:alpha/beta hydrolase-fold protein [Paucimonas sp.]
MEQNKRMMIKIRQLIGVLTLLAASLFSAAAAADGDAIGIGERRTIQSRVLGEEREILIHLPQSYRSGHRHTRYPVLYFLDGEKFFHSFSGAIQQLSSDATPHIPEMIAVGIVGKDRYRDSSPTRSLRGFDGKETQGLAATGGGERFLRFVREELIPFVEREYSTTPYRLYAGYSFTGLSALHALFSMPESFNAYLIIDPSWWWDGYVMERMAAASLKEARFDRIQLFIATTGQPYPENFFPRTRDAETLARMLDAAKPRGLDWEHRRYGNESHHSLPMLALYDGLTHIFRGYMPKLDDLYNDVGRIAKQHEALSRRLGGEFRLREDLLKFFGYQFLYQYGKADKAIDYFDLNARYYPESSDAWDSLAEAHLAKGDKAAARRMYAKALALDKSNRSAAARLKELDNHSPGTETP